MENFKLLLEYIWEYWETCGGLLPYGALRRREETVDMEQVVREAQAGQEIRKKVEEEFGMTTPDSGDAQAVKDLWREAVPDVSEGFLERYLEDRADDNVVFALKDGSVRSMLALTPYFAAVRRNPPSAGAGRVPCMADVARVPSFFVSMAATERECRGRGYMHRLMQGALSYQQRRKIPFCFAGTGNEEFLRRFGFQPVYDRPQYRLDTPDLPKELLKRAAGGEKVPLASGRMLAVADDASLFAIAHFVNARLCTRCGLFTIRNAAYYERFQREITSGGGNLYQITEGGSLRGYFACTGDDPCSVREAVFQEEAELARYLGAAGEKKPAAMARIVNLPEMLRYICGIGKVTIAIRLKDPVIAENDGLFIWHIDKDGSRMERVEEADGMESSVQPEVTATIGEFTAFVFEYKKLKQNMKFDSIYLTGPACFNERF